ncbi:MAG TPA: tetratricopeptide repeat protein [Terriglobales bacterium]
MRLKVSLLVVLLCVIALSAHAQVGISDADAGMIAPITPTGHANPTRVIDQIGSISGTAVAIDGSPLHDCRIELHDASRGTVLTETTTGPSGNFAFRNLNSGSYEVVAISGLDQAHERVDVLHNPSTVTLRLSVQNPDNPRTGTVSVAEFKIPEKARQEWTKGEHALLKNKLEDARKHADRALSIAPHYAQALTLRGILKLGANDTASGVADLQQSIKNDPNYAMGYIALGSGLNAQRNWSEAARAIERGVAIDPNAWQGWFELSKAEIAQGQFKDALKHITRAEELNKDYPSIHLLMAHSLLGNRQYSRAIEEYELFLSQEPNSPNAQGARAGLNEARSFMQSAAK